MWSGKSRADKCQEIRDLMKKEEKDLFLLTSLEDIPWLLNIRGNDIHCCPVVLAYLMMTEKEILLFADKKAFSQEIQDKLAADGVTLHPYEQIYEEVKGIRKGTKVVLDKEKVNYLLLQNISQGAIICDEQNLTLLPKAIKNPVEVENMKKAHIRDGIALTKFICWLKKNIGKVPMTELSVTDKLYSFRKEQEHFLGSSFDPIVSYGEHAAMNHYSAT